MGWGLRGCQNRVLDNLTEVLKAGGAGLGDVIKVTICESHPEIKEMRNCSSHGRLFR